MTTSRVAVTTIVRGAPVDVPSAWLRVVSLESGIQEAMAPLPDAVHALAIQIRVGAFAAGAVSPRRRTGWRSRSTTGS